MQAQKGSRWRSRPLGTGPPYGGREPSAKTSTSESPSHRGDQREETPRRRPWSWMGTHKLATGNRQRPTDGPGRCAHGHPRVPPVTQLSTQKVPRTLGAGISARPTGGPGGASMTTSGRHVGARVVRIWPQVLETGNRCWLTRRTRRCAHGHPGVPQVAPPPTQKVSNWTQAQYPSPAGVNDPLAAARAPFLGKQ